MAFVNGVRSTTAKTNQPAATPERIAVWHSNLLQRADATTGPSVAAAIYATGDGKSDLPQLAAALAQVDEKAAKRLAASAAMSVVIPKLPWPEGRIVLEKLSQSPILFVLAAVENEQAKSEAVDFLLDAARFKAAVERASGDDLMLVLQRLLQDSEGGNRRVWSLFAPGERTRGIVSALLDSTNAAWRAAGVYAMSRREAETRDAVFENALKDASPWVRIAGVQGKARVITERAVLEERIGPMLDDSDGRVAEVASLALLESELRAAAGLQWNLTFFRFEELRAGSSESVTVNEDRPLVALENKPAYLQRARRHLVSTVEVEKGIAFALLLAQHGEFDGMDRLMSQLPERDDDKSETLPDALLAGIALSRDAKYLPFLRRLMERAQQDWDLRKILRALKGMTGTEARQLRVDVNKRMRTASAVRVE
jgi:hypothetical protein